MKRNKATGADDIAIEMVSALEDLGLQKLTELLNEIYDTGVIPEDMSKSVFICLPKKPGATTCELHRTISLMSHITKVLMRILMNRARGKWLPEIAPVQFGFTKDSGTRNAIFTLRAITERAIEKQIDLYLCFIDYSRAFDKVKHGDLMKILQRLHLDGKDIRILSNLYWDQTACVRLEHMFSEYKPIKRGVRQGCVMSPDLFNLYSETILRNLDEAGGIAVGGVIINNIRYADDTALIATSEEGIQSLLNTVVEASESMGLHLNVEKTVCMTISKKEVPPACTIQASGKIIKQVEQFNYLGSYITSNGKCDKEISRRIGMAKSAFQRMKTVLLNPKLHMDTKQRVLRTYIMPILTYGSDTWTISQTMQARLEAVEMWFLRRILKISYTEHVTNKEVLERAATERSLIKYIRKSQMQFLGHIVRKGGIENLALTGTINGRRDRGRQRLTYLNSVSEWTNTSTMELLRCTRNRKLWQNLTADVCLRHGT